MKKLHIKRILIFLITLLIISGFCIWQNNDIVISEYVYKSEKIDSVLDGYKIAQISDLHNKEFGYENKNLLAILDTERPDIIVITGDLVDSRKTNIDIALNFIEKAIKIAPIYYVNGNHEERLSDKNNQLLEDGLENIGVTLLNNDFVTLKKDDSKEFYLTGINNNNLDDNTLKKLTLNLDSDKLNILLAHRPQFIESYSDSNIDLVLSGHAHGGQVRLPFLGGLLAPDQGFLPEYTSGIYEENKTTLIVSRGLGNSIIPVRIFNRPDVVIIELKKET